MAWAPTTSWSACSRPCRRRLTITSGGWLDAPPGYAHNDAMSPARQFAGRPTVLTPPAARQGPGPMPDALVEALDLVVKRAVARGLPGDRRAPGVGVGTELAQLRPYQVGDDVRHIDPAATARTGQPHVRLHVPERTLTTWILLDVSPSMAFGTADRLKIDVADGATLALGRAAI